MDTQSLVITKRKFKSTQMFVVAGTILVSLLISLVCVGLTVRYEVDTETADVKSIQYWKLQLPPEQDLWYEKGLEELKSVIVKKENRAEVENIVIFMVEGATSDMLSEARFDQKENMTKMHSFVWDNFPHLGILRSSCSFVDECDAFTVATALFGGVKTSQGLGGLDRTVAAGNCLQALNKSHHINSIFKQANALGLRTGFVTTGRVTGPLVAALYAHTSNTRWECESVMPPTVLADGCIDVASQLIRTDDGRQINVIMGGGRQTLVSPNSRSFNLSTLSDLACIAQDGRNLLQDWQSFKAKENASFKLVQSSRSLARLKGADSDYVLGIFANGDLTDQDPKLSEMIRKTLDVLKRNNSGFILVADTEIKSTKGHNFRQNLLELDATIKKTLQHESFTANKSVVLTVFLNLKLSSGSVPHDTLLYAMGPKSYLFHGVHEETYMAHVISYYLKMGIFRPKRNVHF